MADPHHIPVLDGFDRWTVQVYRAGLATSSVGLLGLAAALLLDPTGSWRTGAQVLVVAGCALSISCMHLYDKRIRWVIAASGWTGAVLLLTAQGAPASIGHWIHHAGLGFVFVSLSGFAVKEQF